MKRAVGLIICLIGVALGVFGVIEGDRLMILFYIGIGVILFGLSFFKASTEKAIKICDKCNGDMRGCEYEVESENGGGTRYTVIKAICPNCGEIKYVRKVFICKTPSLLKRKIEKFCRKRFDN